MDIKKYIIAYLPKIKKGGLLYGDDYGHLGFLGVKKAVDEFFEVTLYPVRLNVWGLPERIEMKFGRDNAIYETKEFVKYKGTWK